MISAKNILVIDPADYIKRTAKLDLEAQGFFVRLMACANGRTDSLPDCERQIGQLMHTDVRIVRRLMKKIRKAGLVENRFGLKGAA